MSEGYRIVLNDEARADLSSIHNRATLEQIAARIETLRTAPLLGKPLRGRLAGYRSIRAARNRYRIVYRIEDQVVTVYVVAIGLRKGEERDDVYKKLARLAGK